MYTFPVDRDVIVGRDRDCDICFQDINPEDLNLISRVHAILRFDDGHWVVVDKSQNGIFVAGSRANVIPISDRLSVALGGPRGPELTFRVATPASGSPNRGDSPATQMFRPAAPPPPAPAPPRAQLRPNRPAPPVSSPSAGLLRSATIGRAKTNGDRRRGRARFPRARNAHVHPGRLGDSRQRQQQRHFRQRARRSPARGCATATSSRSATPTCSPPATPWSRSPRRPAPAG